MINIFFDIFEYDGTDFTIDHFKAGISLYTFLISQIYLDNVVSCLPFDSDFV